MKLSALLAFALLAGPVVASVDTLEENFQCLREAVTNKNAPEVKKLFHEVYPEATAAMADHAPEGGEERTRGPVTSSTPGHRGVRRVRRSRLQPERRRAPMWT